VTKSIGDSESRIRCRLSSGRVSSKIQDQRGRRAAIYSSKREIRELGPESKFGRRIRVIANPSYLVSSEIEETKTESQEGSEDSREGSKPSVSRACPNRRGETVSDPSQSPAPAIRSYRASRTRKNSVTLELPKSRQTRVDTVVTHLREDLCQERRAATTPRIVQHAPVPPHDR